MRQYNIAIVLSHGENGAAREDWGAFSRMLSGWCSPGNQNESGLGAFAGPSSRHRALQRRHRDLSPEGELPDDDLLGVAVIADLDVGDHGRRAEPVVVNVRNAEDGNSICGRGGHAGAATAASGRFLHSFECGQPGRLQAELLREQELLRCLEEKHAASRAAARQKR